MMPEHVQLMMCVDCGGPLDLDASAGQAHVVDGLLTCLHCARVYPVLNGVGIMFRRGEFLRYLSPYEAEKLRGPKFAAVFSCLDGVSAQADTLQVKVALNWEYQHSQFGRWENLAQDGQFFSRSLFFKFIPIDEGEVSGKSACAACVGRGKEVAHLLAAGAALVAALEIGNEIHEIPDLLPGQESRLLLFRCDASKIPLKEGAVDIAICDHALQHIKDHRVAYGELARVARPGGLVAICVYSWENNFLMTHVIEPMKALFLRLPLRLLRFLSWFPAMMVYLAIHLVYLPTSKHFKDLAHRLPLFDHMMFWSPNPFRFVHLACFDLMHAPISYHFRKTEVEALAAGNGLELLKLLLTHGTTWSSVARKKTVTSAPE